MTARKPAPLPGLEVDDPKGTTAVYQGVTKTIRYLEERQGGAEDVATWRARYAALCSQARSIARAIDASHGDPARGIKPQGGMQVASLHAELRAILEALDPAEALADPAGWDALTAAMGTPVNNG